MWMNPENYKYINEAREILMLLREIIVKKEGNLMYDKFPNDVRFRHRPNRTDINWEAIILYLKPNPIPNLNIVDARFEHIYSILKNNPSFVEAVINYVGPNSISPLHSDKGAYAFDSWAIEPTYQLVGGIYSPSGDMGLEMGGIPKKWESGEFIAFDGETLHHGWNRTDEWRISLYLDVKQTDFYRPVL